jgi:thymidylate kinase (EC 2.7.4.9)
MSHGRTPADGGGQLITLEGLDGSGKSTVIEGLQRRHPEWCFTCEPTTSWYGDAVRRSVESDAADPIAELFLFIADHAEHLRTTIRPGLEAGEVIVSDRYIDSRIAYQAVTLAETIEAPAAFITAVHEPFTILPDLTVFLEVDPETAARRSGATNKFEQVAHLQAVSHEYERLIDHAPDRFVRIDATSPPADVLDAVERAVGAVLHR